MSSLSLGNVISKRIMLFMFCTDLTAVTKKLEGAVAEDVKVKEPINQQIHRMCLLRVKLMHFVNSLHNYITTRVRHYRRCHLASLMVG